MNDTSWLVDETALDLLVYELSEQRLKDLDGATQKTLSLLDISKANENAQTTAVLIGVLASCYRWDSKLFEAYKLAKESAYLLERMDMAKYQVLSLNVLGLCHKDMGDPVSAFEVLLNASRIAEDHGFHREFTLTSLNLAYAYANHSRREQAIQQYLTILNGYSQHCKPFEIPVILNNLASNSIELKRWDDALNYVDQALAKVEEDNAYLYPRILTNKAMVLAWKGHTAEALEIAERVQGLCKESNRLAAMPSIWYGLGEVFLNASRFNEAKSFLETAYVMSFEAEGRPHLRQILELLARTHQGLGNFELACGALGQVVDLAAAQSGEQIEATVKSALLRQQVEAWEKEAGALRLQNLELVAVHEQSEADHLRETKLFVNEVTGPASAVVELADELLTSRLDPEQRERVRTIRTYGSNLVTVVNGIKKSSQAVAPRGH